MCFEQKYSLLGEQHCEVGGKINTWGTTQGQKHEIMTVKGKKNVAVFMTSHFILSSAHSWSYYVMP